MIDEKVDSVNQLTIVLLLFNQKNEQCDQEVAKKSISTQKCGALSLI